jgi:hypothetical protein
VKDGFRKHVRQAASSKWRLESPGEDWCLGVCSVQARYEADLERCVDALGDACRRLELEVMGADVRPDVARVNARTADQSELLRIDLRSAENGSTWVSFSVGREWTHDIQKLISGLREAFECELKGC